MAKQGANPAAVWRLIMFTGLSDVAIGAGLAVAGLAGVLGEDGTTFAIVGGVMALIGVGLTVFARQKLSEADDRRGDLN